MEWVVEDNNTSYTRCLFSSEQPNGGQERCWTDTIRTALPAFLGQTRSCCIMQPCRLGALLVQHFRCGVDKDANP